MAATATRAPLTEDDLRAALSALSTDVDLDQSFWDALAPLCDSDVALVRAGWSPDYRPREDHPGTLWADLRPAEVQELADQIDEIVAEERARFVEAVRERLIAWGLAWDAAHLDIPRGHWEPR